MTYIEAILEPGEKVRHWGEFHWSLHLLAGSFLGLGLFCLGLVFWTRDGSLAIPAIVLLFLGVALLLRIWTTEMAVTNKRVLMKTGWIARRTSEMNLSKVESVSVDQGVFGRLLGFGTVRVHGTGSGLTPFTTLDKPLLFRKAIVS